MHEEYYHFGSLMQRAAGWGVFALLCFWADGTLGTIVGLIMAMMAFAYASKAFGDRVAVRFGQDHVELHGLGKSVSMQWDDVEDITVQHMRSHLFGFLPTYRTHQLTLVASKDRMPLSVGVPAKLLDLDREGLVRLVKTMIFARSGGYDLIDPRTGELRANQPTDEPAQPRPAAGGFGRKGL